jgi:hypothetical protein
MRGCSGDFSPTSSRGSAGCPQLGTDMAHDALVDRPAARRHPATGRADRRARSVPVPELPQLGSSLSCDPPCVTELSSSTTNGTPGAKPGYPGHRQALPAPTEVIEVTPDLYACGQQEFPATTPYHTHQVIELPELRMAAMHVVSHETQCPRCNVVRTAVSANWSNFSTSHGPRRLGGAQAGNLTQALD